ncbi:MAG: hypothetical protein HY721_24830, partial [Planctomycetes bacterium]|nr:hypothetical protein [Planctomycetota bacterium]
MRARPTLGSPLPWTLALLLAQGVAAGKDTAGELEALRSRVAELERALREPDEPRPPPAAPAAGDVSTVIRTDGLRAKGLEAKPGALGAEGLRPLLSLFEEKDGVGLARELEMLLEQGEAGYPALYDFFMALPSLGPKLVWLTTQDALAYALVDLVARHEDEAGKLAQYLLAATDVDAGAGAAAGPAGPAREVIVELGPIFVRFHKGRFPDLEDDLRHEYLKRFEAFEAEPQAILEKLELLDGVPPLETVERLLRKASNYNEITPLVMHLERRNDDASAQVLDRVLDAERRFQEPKADHILLGLARMAAPAAQKALTKYMQLPRSMQARRAAYLAYFSVPRGSRSVNVALGYLNSGANLRDVSTFLRRLHQANPEILGELKERLDWVGTPQVKELVLRDGLPPPAGPAGQAGQAGQAGRGGQTPRG